MPKIFLINKRLHQQQQSLLENQKGNDHVSSSNSLTQSSYQTQLISPSQPILNQQTELQSSQPYFVQYTSPETESLKDENLPKIKLLNNKNDNCHINDIECNSISSCNQVSSKVFVEQSTSTCSLSFDWNLPPKKRIIPTSDIGNILYSSKNNFQIIQIENFGTNGTAAEPILHNPPSQSLPKFHRISVIQKTPKSIKLPQIFLENPLDKSPCTAQKQEQEAIINFHMPKKKSNLDLDNVQTIKNKCSIMLHNEFVLESKDTNTAPDKRRRRRGGSARFLGNGTGDMVLGEFGMNSSDNLKQFNRHISLLPFDNNLIKSDGNYFLAQNKNQNQIMMNEQLFLNKNTDKNSMSCIDDPHKQYLLQHNTSLLNIKENYCKDLSSSKKETDGFGTLMSKYSMSKNPIQFTATHPFVGPSSPEILNSFNDTSKLFFKNRQKYISSSLVDRPLQMFNEHKTSVLNSQLEQHNYLPQNYNSGQLMVNRNNNESYNMSKDQLTHGILKYSNQQQKQLQQPQNVNSPELPSLEMDSNTRMFVPSPTSVGIDHTMSFLALPLQYGMNKKHSILDTKILLHKLGLPNDYPLEFINGGHGIKNPLCNENTIKVPKKRKNNTKVVPSTVVLPMNISSEPPYTQESSLKFCCNLCSKTFKRQGFLTRHMRIHNDMNN